jgi:hypothetical protein
MEHPETRPPWEEAWDRALALGLPEPAPAPPDVQEVCFAGVAVGVCLNPPQWQFPLPGGTSTIYACNIHKASQTAIVASMQEVRRNNSLWGRLTFRRLRSVDRLRALDDLITGQWAERPGREG